MAELVFAPNAATGNTSTLASWINVATGLAPASLPASGDSVAIGTRGNSGTAITASSATSGATSITLSGTSIVLKKNAIIKITGTTGVYMLRDNRTGNGAVSIYPALRASVSASSVVTYYNGCDTVTHDIASATWGDDNTWGMTATNGGGSIMIGTNFYFSRSTSTTTTLRGTVFIADGSTFDMGTEADPISNSAVVHNWRLNDSSSAAAGKYPMQCGITANTYRWGSTSTSVFSIRGVARKRATRLFSSISAGATSCDVTDGTGWAVGDTIFFSATSNSGQGSGAHTGVEEKTISTISLVSGTRYTITWSGGLTQDHSDQGYVYNVTSNCRFAPATSTNRAATVFECNSASTTQDHVYVRYAEFRYGGGNQISTNYIGALSFSNNDTSSETRHSYIRDCSFWDLSGGSSVRYFGNSNLQAIIENSVFCNSASGTSISFESTASAAAIYVNDCHFFRGPAFDTTFGYGDAGTTFNRCIFSGCYTNTDFIPTYDGGPAVFNDCFFGSTRYVVGFNSTANILFNECYIGTTHPIYGGGTGSPSSNTANVTSSQFPSNSKWTDCIFSSFGIFSQNTSLNPDPILCKHVVLNKNADPTSQEEYYRNGTLSRDNSTINRSRSSFEMSVQRANIEFERIFSLQGAVVSTPVIVKGFLRFDTNYGTGTPPTIELSGLGSTPESFTAPATANAWHEFELNVTPTSSGSLTLTITGQSTATNGNCWLDGISLSPFSEWSQHYGYTYAPTAQFLTVDDLVVLSESAAGALTGISYSTGTLSITSNKTISEIYDWMKWYEANNRLDPLLTSSDGVNFSLNANLSVATGVSISGTGTVTLTASKTLTMTGTASSSVILSADAGTTGYITLTVPNASAVAIYDTGSSRVQFTGSSGTSITQYVPPATTGDYTYKVAKYGKTAVSGSITMTGGGYKTASITLSDDTAITQATAATVAAYTTLETTSKIYDYASYNMTLTGGIDYALPVTKAGSVLDFGSRALTIDAGAGSVFAYSGAGVTVKASNIAQGAAMTSVLTTGTITLSGGAVAGTAPLSGSNGKSAYLSLLSLTSSASIVCDNAGATYNYTASTTGTYNLVIPFASTGSWTWTTKRKGYRHATGNFTASDGGFVTTTPSMPQKLTPQGDPMYAASTSSLVTVSFNGTTQANIDIGDGIAELQPTFDETEDALVTQSGMEWLCDGKSDTSLFNSAGGDYLFLSTGWRLRRASAGDANATLNAFCIGADGTIVDDVNGGVQFLTSDSPTAIAAAVIAAMNANPPATNIKYVNDIEVGGVGTTDNPWNPA